MAHYMGMSLILMHFYRYYLHSVQKEAVLWVKFLGIFFGVAAKVLALNVILYLITYLYIHDCSHFLVSCV